MFGVSFITPGQRIEKSRQKRRITAPENLTSRTNTLGDHTYGRTATRDGRFSSHSIWNLQLDPPLPSDGYKKLIVERCQHGSFRQSTFAS